LSLAVEVAVLLLVAVVVLVVLDVQLTKQAAVVL
jgi:hypothetical protein